jgi:hypothetical protein
MTDVDVKDHLEHQQWLINNGFINDLHKDNLYMYGAILNLDITSVELEIRVESKVVKYKLYCSDKLCRLLVKYKKLKQSKSLWSLWRLKRLLNKTGSLEFNNMLNSFVKDYCGKQWKAEITILRDSEYKDGFEEQKRLPENSKPNP